VGSTVYFRTCLRALANATASLVVGSWWGKIVASSGVSPRPDGSVLPSIGGKGEVCLLRWGLRGLLLKQAFASVCWRGGALLSRIGYGGRNNAGFT
jgi:hypothetical protein